MKNWKPFKWGSCPECGGDAEGGFVCDDDEARCVACGLKRITSVDEYSIYINWNKDI